MGEKLDQETKARIVSSKSQMKSFCFFFGINLSYKLYAMTDNMSKSLQLTKMSAISGRKSAYLVIDTLKNMKNDDDFHLFFEVVKKVANLIKSIEKPVAKEKKKIELFHSSIYHWLQRTNK